MPITATFSKTNKRINSTKQPVAAADDISLSVELKQVTNLFTPSLIISDNTFMSGGAITNPMKYNYCYLPDFERYYFVRSWSWVLGRWECALEVDVMASFKSDIGNTTTMVLRSASSYNADIIDTKYPTYSVEAGALQVKKDFANTSFWNTNIKTGAITDGFYVISVVNDDSSAVGGVSYYAFSCGTMQELMNKLFSAPTWMGITDANISADLQKMLFNPMQYITSCMWIPRGFNTSGATAIHTLPLGWWSLTLTGSFYRIDATRSVITFTTEQAIQSHPQYDASKRRWVQLSPYTQMSLYMPPFGFIPLDTTKFYLSTKIVLSVRIDCITGRGTLYVSHKYNLGGGEVSGGIVYTTVSQVGVPVSIAQMAVSWDMLSSASTWVMAAGVSLATGGLQESLKNLQNGLVSGIKDIFGTGKNKSDGSIRWNPQLAGGGAAGEMYNNLMGGLSTAVGIGNNGLQGVIQAGLQSGLDSVGATKETSLLSSLKEIAGDIGSTALAAAGTCSSSGSAGGFAALQELSFVEYFFLMITGIDDTHNGLPLCQSKKISTLSGFVLCGNTDAFTANCTPAERQAICGIMEAGFYYE